ncbi:YheC/YheD family protein [Clostridium thermarum]|uniref:YheC/YheD family endospore coat-associated protein n=1 Tax=Clostridium thermarum TaxID=1716543 RepID=UPI0013D8BA67|nr:YheC/YheD family protein [Clostridium thermarum]
MLYRITSDKYSTDKIIVSERFFKGTLAAKKSHVDVSVGSKTVSVELIKDARLRENRVKLSNNVIDELLLPEDVDYQIIHTKEGFRIGPIIGLLMSNSKSSIGRGSLSKMNYYTIIHPEIGGLLVTFSSDSVDFNKKCVDGYYYSDNLTNRKLPWRAGVLPMPDSVFSRTMVSDEFTDKLKEVTNNRFFNSKYFNKWEFWRLVSRDNTCCKYIPDTRLYSGLEDIDYMIENYGAAYIKPLNGTLSRGLYKVTRTGEGYGVQGKQGDKVDLVSNRKEAEEYFKKIMKGHKYIVQQSITPLKVKGRHMDFRVIMQKDQTLDWQCTGIVALIGARGDICTNWGNTSSFEDIFYKAFDFNQQQIYKKKSEVVGACKSICDLLDATGENYGDLGFDVVVDENYKVWVLEANKRHYHSVPLWINDVQTFYQTKSNPIKYAAAQAGFCVY